jgi:glycosyltransferase involved in cell wall biosynthesis
MHIVFVTHAFPRWDGDVAGTFIERLARALVARGHRLTVLTPSDQGRGGPERRSGVDVQWVRYAPTERETLAHRGTMVEETSSLGGKVAALAMVMTLARPINRLARRGAVDIVHAHWWIPGGIAAWFALRKSPCPYVITLHGTDVRLLPGSALARGLARRVLARAGAVTAVSSYLADSVARATGLPTRDMMVQPMPADLARFTHRSRGGGGVVTVGRLVTQKRIDILLDAVARLRAQGRTVPLKIIGDGPLRDALEERAVQLGIGDTTQFLGVVAPSQLSEAIGNADVFAFTAQGEGLGLAAAEALMMGIPVVAMEGGGGVADVVPSHGAGRIVPEGDALGLSAALAELIDDPNAKQSAADTGLQLRERFEPESVAQCFEDLYTKVRSRFDADA